MALHRCPKCDARFRGELSVCPIDGTPLLAPSDPYIGRVIAGRYVVEELLGIGGMGSVYRALHQYIGRSVALKFLDTSFASNDRLRQRFLGEARAANQINHEHIIDITDFGETEDGIIYMVMEYLKGHSLESELDRGPLELRRALHITFQMALGLGRAHELGVVHRDIKPGNVHLIRRGADPDFVKILDFGVARIEQDARITGQDMIVGTPEYMAPEQVRSSSPTAASDLYSLGCVLFETLTGKLPFEGKTTTALLTKHLNDPVASPSSINREIPSSVDRIVLKLMEKKPEKRHRDAFHLADELRAMLSELDPLPQAQQVRSAPPVRTAPVAHEEDDWARTLAAYKKLQREAERAGRSPDWVEGALADIDRSIREIRALRAELDRSAAHVTEQQEQNRTVREQLGHALDELLLDDSKIGGELAELGEKLTPAEARLDVAVQAIIHDTSALPQTLRAGELVTPRHMLALQELTRANAELALARDGVHRLRARVKRKETERKDLRFQMSELKHRLDLSGRTSTVEQQLWHSEADRISAQIQAKLEQLAPLGARVAKHFGSEANPKRRAEAPSTERTLG